MPMMWHIYIIQDGTTALMLAVGNSHEAAAAELMETTKLASVLDLQVAHTAEGERGAREEERGAWHWRVRVRASRQDDDFERSALNVASFNGLAGTVAKLLALGADATLTDEVRACI
jgi:hypothetical protein